MVVRSLNLPLNILMKNYYVIQKTVGDFICGSQQGWITNQNKQNLEFLR